MPRPKRIESGESLYSHIPAVGGLPDKPAYPPNTFATPKTMIGEENNMQRIHHIVRTASLDNRLHESGAAPLGNIEKDINADWLSKGWQVISVSVLRVGQSEFEILYTLVQNVP